MHRPRKFAFASLLFSCLMVLFALPDRAAADEIYKWVDAQGNTHFVDSPDKIPAEYRNKSEYREVEAPAAGASQGSKKPAQLDPEEPADVPPEDDDEDEDQDRASYCQQGWDANIPACLKACINTRNTQAKKDCEEARQARRAAREAARKEREDRRRVEERTRCLQGAQSREEAADCVQRSLPPPSDEVKTVEP